MALKRPRGACHATSRTSLFETQSNFLSNKTTMSDNFSNLPNNNNVVDLTGDTSSGSDTEPEPEHVPAVIHHVPDVIDISSGSEAEIVPAPVPVVNFWALANPNPAPINHFWGVNLWNAQPIDHFWGSSTSESSDPDWPNEHVEPVVVFEDLQVLPFHYPVGNLQPLPNHVPAGDEAASEASVSLGESDTDSTASVPSASSSESNFSLDSDESEHSFDSDSDAGSAVSIESVYTVSDIGSIAADSASDGSDDSTATASTSDGSGDSVMADYESDESAFYIEPPIPPQLPDFCGDENDLEDHFLRND